MPCPFQSSHAEDIIRLINRYKGTLNRLTIYLEKVNMTAFSKIYDEVVYWTINTPTTEYISLTASYVNNQRCESLPKYNNMQESFQFLMKCKRYSECFKITREREEREKLCAKIIEDNPEFTKNFSKYAPSKIKKFMENNHIYNIFLGYYINNSTILKGMSEWCDKEKGEPLPYNAKKCIVEHIGGIGVITEIDNALENNNSTTYQQDEVINCAEAVNDVNLTTSGTTTNCCSCLIM